MHRVPAGIPDEAAVFTEPLAAACEILEQVDVRAHREACVLGDGKLAQLIARVLHASGLRVVMIGKHASKLRLARLAGIATCDLAAARGAPRADAFTLVVEATGSPSGLAMAQQITAPRGTLVLKSTFHGAAPVETWPIVVKELTVIGSRCGPFRPALALLRSGRVDPRPLISRDFPFERCGGGDPLRASAGGDEGVAEVVDQFPAGGFSSDLSILCWKKTVSLKKIYAELTRSEQMQNLSRSH